MGSTSRLRVGGRVALAAVAASLLWVLAGPPGGIIARGGTGRQPSAAPQGQDARKNAVIVVGPVGSDTSTYLARGETIARAAEAHGMHVVRIFTPRATWARVVAQANGADLFVYLGHGNGWPSPHPPFQEDTKDGLGLNPHLNDTDTYDVRYYGANLIRSRIHFAPNAIVLLNKLCYADGNAEEGMPIPNQDTAVKRVENFASGFLASGAAVVFALGWQPGENLVDSLFSTPTTMDGFFQMRFGANRDGSYKPWFGWIGWKPDLYLRSSRNDGARIHLDPDPQEGYLRAVTGDLGMTTQQWRGAVDPGDTHPPVLSHLTGSRASDTIAAGGDGPPVFTPNGDGRSDTIWLRYRVSEPTFLAVEINGPDETTVRRFTAWSGKGRQAIAWDGRSDRGRVVSDGDYLVTLRPRDAAGNRGRARSVRVRLLTTMKAPVASPALFDPEDGDGLARTSRVRVRLMHAATLSVRIRDEAGGLVRRGMVDRSRSPGVVRWSWDGRDDNGRVLARGVYSAVVTASTHEGSYSHMLRIRLMPFQLKARLWVRSGQRQQVALRSAEPVDGWPRVLVKQPGLPAYRLDPVRYGPTTFRLRWTPRAGPSGPIVIRVWSMDTAGGTQTQRFHGGIE